MRLAVLDVGSNTVNVLVVDASQGSAPLPVHSERMDLRLAEHIGKDGQIAEAAVTSLIEVVRHAGDLARKLRCIQFESFATSALRDAANGRAIIRRVHRETGVKLSVMSGTVEAELTFLAVRRWYGWSSGRLFVADIGGGSVELAVGSGECPEHATSLLLGAGRMYREFLHDDPPRSSQVSTLSDHVQRLLEPVAATFMDDHLDHVVGTSKTFRQLARLAHRTSPHRDDSDEGLLYADDLKRLRNRIVKMSLDERSALPGISGARAPQLAAGAIVASELMDSLGLECLEVCPWALREGVILRRIDALRNVD